MYKIVYVFGDINSDLININTLPVAVRHHILPREFDDLKVAVGYALALIEMKTLFYEKCISAGTGYFIIGEPGPVFNIIQYVINSDNTNLDLANQFARLSIESS